MIKMINKQTKGINLELANTRHGIFNPISECFLFSHPRFYRTTIPTRCPVMTDSEMVDHPGQRPGAPALHQVQRDFRASFSGPSLRGRSQRPQFFQDFVNQRARGEQLVQRLSAEVDEFIPLREIPGNHPIASSSISATTLTLLMTVTSPPASKCSAFA